jgi:hypothetical protein
MADMIGTIGLGDHIELFWSSPMTIEGLHWGVQLKVCC